MARFRRQLALRPINRIKHVVDTSGTLSLGTELPTKIIEAVDAPVLASVRQVVTGSKVHAVYLKIEVASDDDIVGGAIPNVYLTVAKNPGGNLTLPAPNAVGSSDNKRFVIHQEMIMIQNVGRGGNARILFNGVIKIPKGYQRFGPNDTLVANVLCPQLDIATCLQCHYKEFR